MFLLPEELTAEAEANSDKLKTKGYSERIALFQSTVISFSVFEHDSIKRKPHSSFSFIKAVVLKCENRSEVSEEKPFRFRRERFF